MPIAQLDQKWYRGEYLNFHDEGLISPGSVTHVFKVMSRLNGSVLGSVRWFIQWRQYCFFPLNAVFDKKCLREVAEFCEQMTEERRAKRKG